jgi:hypothetical protein
MKTEIVFMKIGWEELTGYFSLDSENESRAVALAKLVKTGQLLRFLVCQLVIPKDADYLERTPFRISMTPEFMERNFQRCEERGFHLVNIHNHPFSKRGRFSPVDDTEDKHTKGPYVEKWVPDTEQAFMVLGSNPTELDARFWSLDSRELVPVDLVKII